MLRSLVTALILLLALSSVGSGATARHIDHCGTLGPAIGMTLMSHESGMPVDGATLHHHDAQPADVAGDTAEKGTTTCDQHSCSIHVYLPGLSTSSFDIPIVATEPADTRVAGLSRPESLYRPPKV